MFYILGCLPTWKIQPLLPFWYFFSSLSAPEKILPPTLLGKYVLPLVKKFNTFVTQEEVKPKEK